MCYGCSNAIRTDISTVPPPPQDLVVRFKERRYYRDSETGTMKLTQKEENIMQQCILIKHPSFVPSMLVTPLDIELAAIHKCHLYDNFGIIR